MRPGNLEIDVTSFSDIAFLLIIFFILTTSLARPLGQTLEIPSAAAKSQESSARTPSVNILADRILIGEGEGQGPGRELTLTALRADLMQRRLASRPPKERMVVLEVAEDVPYERYYQVVTAVAEAGGVVAMLGE